MHIPIKLKLLHRVPRVALRRLTIEFYKENIEVTQILNLRRIPTTEEQGCVDRVTVSKNHPEHSTSTIRTAILGTRHWRLQPPIRQIMAKLQPPHKRGPPKLIRNRQNSDSTGGRCKQANHKTPALTISFSETIQYHKLLNFF